MQWMACMVLAATHTAKKLFCKTVSAAIFRNSRECILGAFGALILHKFITSLIV